jgi:hypothetical protein
VAAKIEEVGAGKVQSDLAATDEFESWIAILSNKYYGEISCGNLLLIRIS